MFTKKAVVLTTSVLCLTGLFGSYTMASAHTAGSASLKNLVLTKSDMPVHFVLESTQGETAATNAKKTTAESKELRKDGLIGDYDANYQRSDLQSSGGKKLGAGLVDVASGVGSFGTTAGAHSYIQWIVADARRDPTFKSFHMVSLGHIADETVAFTYSQPAGGAKLTNDVLVFRHGKYTGIILIISRALSQTSLDSAAKSYATRFDQRIASNG